MIGIRNVAQVLATALVFVGCASKEPMVLTVSGDDYVQRAAVAAVAEWVDVCHADLSIGPNGIPVREEAVPNHGGITRFTWDGPVAVGYYRQTNLDGMTAVLAHEFGHVLGLDHTPDGEIDIMSAVPSDPAGHVEPRDCARITR